MPKSGCTEPLLVQVPEVQLNLQRLSVLRQTLGYDCVTAQPNQLTAYEHTVM